MESTETRELSRAFAEATMDAYEKQRKLLSDIQNYANDWSGKARDEFDALVNEVEVLFHHHITDLNDISNELLAAAGEIDRVREEIERQKEQERLRSLTYGASRDFYSV
ncbi:WXG100 family type VII secretion target [Mesobacillus zeae]|uniref:WXG100 family type VII secretion target n=1 Tax=Mesobacillus zeae TaxID=1917180 RepID=A0A398B9G2_9BACI|nr:WXG100 family type VII secretion target [Mesobacillus zeae]RID86759.1 WXG100 family type VII secretion target [Mesobacillus zeae]